MATWVKILAGVSTAAALVALVLLVLWPLLRHQLLYPGGRMAPDEGDPARWGLERAERAWIAAEDGVRLHGWWVPADTTARPRCGAVLYFHGNANTIAPRAWVGRSLAALGFDALLLDYRGYGLSEGRPSEAGLRRDARAAWSYVVQEKGVDPSVLVLLGHSLGSAVATDLALERPAAALVLGAPFPSAPELFRAHAPWLPLSLLPWRDGRYEAGSRVRALAMPILVALGERDAVVPPALSRRVFAAAPEPARLVVTAAGHDTLLGDPAVWAALEAFLAEHVCPG